MYFQWRPYVPVARRRANAQNYAAKIAKSEKRSLAPVNLAGQKIASTFWGKAWCNNLEAYSDFSNRLPRGRSYVRNGSVIDLQIERGKIRALVSGSSIYTVTIEIATLPKKMWRQVKSDCARSIDSMLDLLAGRFDEGVMTRLTHREEGLFPKPKEIKMNCSCPDWATMCKHVAAVLYGIGARLDTAPEMLFTLRGVDHTELIGQAVSAENLDKSLGNKTGGGIATGDIGEMFGIDLVNAPTAQAIENGAATPKPVKIKRTTKPSKAKKATAVKKGSRPRPKG
jgi:uncharacterized Zn finger protein